jgi:hypothetical protein
VNNLEFRNSISQLPFITHHLTWYNQIPA